MEADALAQAVDKGEARGPRAHAESEISEKRAPGKGVHRGRRYLSGRPFAALGLRTWRCAIRLVPRAAHGESVAVHVFFAYGWQDALGRHARAGIFSRDAGAH